MEHTVISCWPEVLLPVSLIWADLWGGQSHQAPPLTANSHYSADIFSVLVKQQKAPLQHICATLSTDACIYIIYIYMYRYFQQRNVQVFVQDNIPRPALRTFPAVYLFIHFTLPLADPVLKHWILRG